MPSMPLGIVEDDISLVCKVRSEVPPGPCDLMTAAAAFQIVNLLAERCGITRFSCGGFGVTDVEGYQEDNGEP